MKIGLVLSGGGMRGVAHVGVIRALEEHGIIPTHIAGSSVGAIVGALYAYGYDWKDILNFFRNIQIFELELILTFLIEAKNRNFFSRF